MTISLAVPTSKKFQKSILTAAVFSALGLMGASQSHAAVITWAGPGTGWDTVGSPNWSGDASAFTTGDNVTFSNAGPTGVVIQGGGVAPASTTFASNAQNYTFTGGPITAGTLAVNGGIQTLNNGANTYAGATTINAGTLAVSSTSSILNTTVTVNLGAILDFTAGASTNRYGDTNALNLNSGTWILTNAASVRVSETIGNLNYAGNSVITLNRNATGGGSSTTAVTANLVRTDRGVLVIAPNDITNFGAGSNPRLWLTATSVPTPVNGMVSPEYIFINPATSIATFANYGAVTLAGVANTTSFRQIVYSNALAGPTMASGTTGTGVDTWDVGTAATATLAVGSNKDLYALRLARSLNSGNFTITLRSGGLILEANTANATTNTSTHAGLAFNFGLGGSGAEAFIFANNTANVARTFSILGNITGDSGLTKSGGATLVLSGTNDWTGATQANNVLTINSGVLRLDGGSIPTDGWVHVAAGATFRINALSPTILGLQGAGTVDNSNASNRILTIDNSTATNYSFAGVLANGGAGTLALVKNGTATQTLTGASSYTGPTTINGGILVVGVAGVGSLGDTAVTVTAGTLAGTGSIAGTVAVDADGTIAPGNNAIGTLTINDTLSLAGLSDFQLDATVPSLNSSDQVIGITDLTYGGALQVSLASGTFAVGQSWNLFDFSTYSGLFANDASFGTAGDGTYLPALGAGLWQFDYANGILSIAADSPPIPEPASLSLLALGTLALAIKRRK